MFQDDLQKRTRGVFAEYVRALRARLGDRIAQVILFGSHARGDASSESDIDCLIVVDKVTPDILNVLDELGGEFLYEHGIVISAIPVAEEAYQHQVHNPFFMNIRKEGVVQ